MPRVSIIIAVLNGMRTLGKAIESAQRQTERAIEIIVVDDGSSDGTPEFVNQLALQDSRIKLIRLDKNMGPPAATNIAIREAKGEWIAILDADDWYEPERIDVFLRAAAATDAVMVCDNLKILDHALGKIIEETHHGNEGQLTILTAEHFFQNDSPLQRHSIGYVKPMIKKIYLTDHDIAYDPMHRIGYDFLLVSEILLSGGKAVIVPGAYYIYMHMFSPTTRKKSPYSHTVGNHRLVMQGCEELIAKYNRTMTSGERRALMRRRDLFESYIHCEEMTQALRAKQIGKAAKMILAHPFILALILAAGTKLIYANFLHIRYSLKGQKGLAAGQ